MSRSRLAITFKNVSQPISVFRVIPPGVYEKVV